jgi:hypothetical protein
MPHNPATQTETVEAAYERGRSVGFATAAVALAVVAYVNLLGIEKSLLAIALAIVALKRISPPTFVRTRIRVALALATVHALTVAVIVVVFADKIALLARQVIKLYHSLS